MKNALKSVFVAAIFAVLALPSAVRADSLILTTEEYPPQNFAEDEDISGISTDLLRAALRENDIDASFEIYPWTRAYKKALDEKNTCVYSTTRLPERQSLFKWAGPLILNEWVLLGRKDSPKILSVEQAKAYVIGGYVGSAQSIYLKSLGLNVEEAASDKHNARNLKIGRIDFWAYHRIKGRAFFPLEGTEDLVVSLPIKEAPQYLACNKTVPDAVIDKLNASFARMKNDGTTEAAIDKYAARQKGE